MVSGAYEKYMLQWQDKEMNCGTERWLLLDGDDTLWDSQGLYDQVKAGFERIVQKEGLDSEIAVQLIRRLA